MSSVTVDPPTRPRIIPNLGIVSATKRTNATTAERTHILFTENSVLINRLGEYTFKVKQLLFRYQDNGMPPPPKELGKFEE